MNNLSIILYLADILQNIKPFFQTIGTLLLIVIPCLWLIVAVHNEQCTSYNSYQPWPKPVKWSIFLFIVGFILHSTAAAMPSRDTILLIAASEASEMVIQNDEVREVMGDVKEVIRQQLKKLKE